MKLDQLETFRWVARLGSFSLAAERLNTTQSTVSTRIAELERHFNARLFKRSTRGVTISPKGRELLAYATSIHQLVDEAQAIFNDPYAVSGVMKVGVAELIALTTLPDIISEFSITYPNVSIDLEIGLTTAVTDRLAAHEIELGLVGMEAGDIPGFDKMHVGEVEFAFLASPALGLPKDTVGPDILEKHPLITLGPGSHVANLQEKWFRENGISPPRTSHCNSMLISANLISSGLGIAYLPVGYFSEQVEQGTLMKLDISPSPPPIDFFAIFESGNNSALVSSLVEYTRQKWAPGGALRKFRKSSLAVKSR